MMQLSLPISINWCLFLEKTEATLDELFPIILEKNKTGSLLSSQYHHYLLGNVLVSLVKSDVFLGPKSL